MFSFSIVLRLPVQRYWARGPLLHIQYFIRMNVGYLQSLDRYGTILCSIVSAYHSHSHHVLLILI